MEDIVVTISSKGQITLPKKARQRLQVKPGEQVRIVLPGQSSEVLIKRQPTITDYFGRLDGYWGDSDAAKDLRKLRNQDD